MVSHTNNPKTLGQQWYGCWTSVAYVQSQTKNYLPLCRHPKSPWSSGSLPDIDSGSPWFYLTASQIKCPWFWLCKWGFFPIGNVRQRKIMTRMACVEYFKYSPAKVPWKIVGRCSMQPGRCTYKCLNTNCLSGVSRVDKHLPNISFCNLGCLIHGDWCAYGSSHISLFCTVLSNAGVQAFLSCDTGPIKLRIGLYVKA